jgi:glycosyltransferase involved in cell wall biosynthesis
LKKKKILYLGNNLASKGYSPTSIDILGLQLEEIAIVKRYSNTVNATLRFLDMMVSILSNRKWSDVVLIDTYSSFAFYYATFAALLANYMKIPYILILHGGNLECRLRRNTRFSRYIFKHSYTLVAPSGFMRQLFLKYGYSNIKLIPNNIDLSLYPFLHRIHVRPTILWVRSFASLYNPQLAIYMIDVLKNEFSDIQLCFVGPEKDGTMEECQMLTQEKQLENRIIFKGKLSKDDWIALSAEYDIFLSTTNIDNTPISVMEAMALGMVVVSTNAGGVPYLIEDAENGYLYNVGDLEGLINTMRSVLRLDNGDLSLNARKKAENWDWEIVKEQWKELFDELG